MAEKSVFSSWFAACCWSVLLRIFALKSRRDFAKLIPIKFSANLQFDKPKAEAKMESNAQLRFDIAQKSLELTDLKTQFIGKLEANPIELQIETAALSMNPQQSKSEQIKLSAKIGGTQELSANVVLNKFTLLEKSLNIAEFTLQAQSTQAGASKKINLKSTLSMALETQVIELPQLAMQLKFELSGDRYQNFCLSQSWVIQFELHR